MAQGRQLWPRSRGNAGRYSCLVCRGRECLTLTPEDKTFSVLSNCDGCGDVQEIRNLEICVFCDFWFCFFCRFCPKFHEECSPPLEAGETCRCAQASTEALAVAAKAC